GSADSGSLEKRLTVLLAAAEWPTFSMTAKEQTVGCPLGLRSFSAARLRKKRLRLLRRRSVIRRLPPWECECVHRLRARLPREGRRPRCRREAPRAGTNPLPTERAAAAHRCAAHERWTQACERPRP